MALFEDAVQFGDLVLAHAAWIASDLEEGELICPFVIIQTDDDREFVAFESDSQQESIERGKESFLEYKEQVHFWGFGRESLSNFGSEAPSVDVLVVSAWTRGMDEPVILRQRFNPKFRNGFSLYGRIEVAIHGMIPPEPTSSTLSLIALQGVEKHPQGQQWMAWTKYTSS